MTLATQLALSQLPLRLISVMQAAIIIGNYVGLSSIMKFTRRSCVNCDVQGERKKVTRVTFVDMSEDVC